VGKWASEGTWSGGRGIHGAEAAGGLTTLSVLNFHSDRIHLTNVSVKNSLDVIVRIFVLLP